MEIVSHIKKIPVNIKKMVVSHLDNNQYPNRLSAGLFYSVSTLLGISVIINLFSTYFGIQVTSSFSFLVSDGWCNPETEGLGSHCFGDFSQFVFFDNYFDPFEMKTNVGLSPLTAPTSTFFSIIGFNFGKQLALWVYLSAATISYLSLYFWAVRKYPFQLIPAYVAVLGVGTLPFLAVLDRGNNFAFAIPGLCLAGILLWKNKTNWALLVIILASLVKPQYLILLLPIFLSKYWWKSIISLFSWFAIFLGLFLIYPNPELRFQYWINGLKSYTSYSPLGFDPNFTNISWVNGIRLHLSLFFSHVPGRHELQFWLESNRFVFTVVICCILMSLWFLARNKIHKIYSIFILTLIATFSSSTIAVYYLGVVSLLIVAFLAYGKELLLEFSNLEKIFAWLSIPILAISISPLLIPSVGQEIVSGRIYNYLSLLSPMLWLFWVLALLITTIIPPKTYSFHSK